MTSTELEALIRERLNSVDAWRLIDQHKSQFLEFPDGLFAELVLGDGSRLVDVDRIARELQESLRKQDVDLDVIVRCIWTVQDIQGPVPSAAGSGGMRFPWTAVLASGSLVINVEVDVTHLAVLEIKRRFDAQYEAAGKAVMKEVIGEFLKLQLSFGGESYWDPIRYPRQELNDSALLYLFGHSLVGKK